MGFSYLLIIINIGSSSVTKKEKKGSRKYYASSVKFTTSKNELTQQKPENLLQPTLGTQELSRKRRCHYSRLPGWFTLWPFLKISFRVFESLPKEVTFFFWFRKHLLTSLVVQWLRLLASNGGGTGSIPGWGSSCMPQGRYIYIYVHMQNSASSRRPAPSL